MRAYLVYEPAKKHQAAALEALASGLAAHGIESTASSDLAGLESHDLAVTWGARARITDRPHLILEAGYINGQGPDYVANRLQFISSSWNGIHGHGQDVINRPADRWRALGIELAPWRAGGDYVLVMEQCPGDFAAPDTATWYAVIRAVKHRWKHYKKRQHPLISAGSRPLSADLARAAVAVTWTSTAAVESVIAGVPTITLDAAAIAWPVSSHSIFDPLYIGPREQWAYNLAYRQWTLAELASGEAWAALK